MVVLPVADVVLSIDPLKLTSSLLFVVFEFASVNSGKIKFAAFDFLVVAEKTLKTTVSGQKHA
jgi:hypothetical protein